MIGQIKEVEIGTVYMKDQNGDDSEEVQSPGKIFELKKQGVNTSLTVQSIFVELSLKAGIGDGYLSWEKLGASLMMAMRGEILEEIKEIIKLCVLSPKITDETYEDIGMNNIPTLFMDIYRFQVGIAEKKSD